MINHLQCYRFQSQAVWESIFVLPTPGLTCSLQSCDNRKGFCCCHGVIVTQLAPLKLWSRGQIHCGYSEAHVCRMYDCTPASEMSSMCLTPSSLEVFVRCHWGRGSAWTKASGLFMLEFQGQGSATDSACICTARHQRLRTATSHQNS